MSTIVEAGIPADQFALNETLQNVPGATFEVVRLVANGSERVMPFLWGTADDMDELVTELRADSSTDNIEILAELEDEHLFRMNWMAHIRVILYIVLEEEGTILDAYGKHEHWELRILFPEHDSVSTTSDFCAEYDIELDFERIYELSESIRRGRYGLTDEQYRTITAAYDGGYYDVPRETNLTDIAESRDVSHQALSERLRRGHKTLIQNTLRPEIEQLDES